MKGRLLKLRRHALGTKLGLRPHCQLTRFRQLANTSQAGCVGRGIPFVTANEARSEGRLLPGERHTRP
jgi:hypothetical protein